jgi:hypothetical protein
MIRLSALVVAAATIVTASAYAQTGDTGAAPTGGGATTANTSTGQTTPLPGASKSQGTTSLDRGIQKKDNEIPGQVCKGC